MNSSDTWKLLTWCSYTAFSVYDALSAASNISKIPPTPNLAQGVFARADDIAGFVPVYDCCFNTGMLDSGWPVSEGGQSDLREIGVPFCG